MSYQYQIECLINAHCQRLGIRPTELGQFAAQLAPIYTRVTFDLVCRQIDKYLAALAAHQYLPEAAGAIEALQRLRQQVVEAIPKEDI